MFQTAILSNGMQGKRMWTACLGVTGQALIVGGLLLAPMIWTQSLPDLRRAISLSAPPPPPGHPQPPETAVEPRRVIPRPFHETALTQPPAIPPRLLILDEEAPQPSGAVTPNNAVAGGLGDPLGVVGAIPDPFQHVARPKPPDAAPVQSTPPDPGKPPRITVLRMAEPLRKIPPVYPPLARATRVSGKVELVGVLGTDGRIHELKVLSGHPLLVKAAADAVMQWVYRPTILNGQAVEVSAPITVNFILN